MRKEPELFHVCKHCDYIIAPRPDIEFDPDAGVCPACGKPIELTPMQKAFWREIELYMKGQVADETQKDDDMTQLESSFQIPDHILQQMPRGRQFILECIEGPVRGKKFELKKRHVVLGRTEGDILIPDPLISRKHAMIEILSQTLCYVKDLASRNGTFVNDRRVSYLKIRNGDRIRLGRSVFLFHIYETM